MNLRDVGSETSNDSVQTNKNDKLSEKNVASKWNGPEFTAWFLVGFVLLDL